jgi:uncharacterized protein GlcG (DUF336 family)
MGSRDLVLKHRLSRTILSLMAIVMVCLSGNSLAWLIQSGPVPQITSETAVYDPDGGNLIIRGLNFQKGATVALNNAHGPISFARAKVKGSTKIVINGVAAADITEGIDMTVTNPDGVTSAMVHITAQIAADESKLTAADVKTIISQAVAQADVSGLKVTIAVTDKEGNILGIFRMTGARNDITIGGGRRCSASNSLGNPICGLDGLRLSDGATLAAISKAVTGAFLSSQGHSFTTRTASFIVQEHFPPGVNFQTGGPLFGVQFSQFLICSDINARSPLGLSADPGGIALYKNGIQVGGIGVEGDGAYTLDPDPTDDDQPVEELIARAATRGFETPPEIQGDKIIVNGIRFTFVNTPMPPQAQVTPFDQLRGAVVTLGPLAPGIRDAQPSRFTVTTIDPSAPAGRVDSRFFPFNGGSVLSRSDVQQILVQAARQAFITRAAIRQPLNSPAEVNISVVDVDGTVLGIFSTIDAPIFGFDVCVQKARTAAFFSKASAGAELLARGMARYVDAANRDGVKLDGSVAFSNRAQGFLERPFFPDGIDDTENGPFSVPIEDFSPFNVGLQLDLLLGAIGRFVTAGTFSPADCTGIPSLKNGIQIFPGSVPLYKNGKLAGAVGVSGDGVDQDDLISTMGSAGFESPLDIRTDRVFVRGVRLPFVKFPRHPNR